MSTRNKKQKIDIEKTAALSLLFTEQWRDIFEEHILPKLENGNELKFLKMSFRDARLAIRRSGIDLEDEFNIREFTSISQLEFAWDNLHLDEDEYGGAQEIARHHFVTSAQPLSPTQPIHCFNRYRRAWFCYIVAQMNKLEYLVWAQK